MLLIGEVLKLVGVFFVVLFMRRRLLSLSLSERINIY